MFETDAFLRPPRSIESRVAPAATVALICGLCVTIVLPVRTFAQGTSDSHAQHHAAGAAGPGAEPGAKDMMGDMGRMMESHRPAQKELYPSLMELPDMPAEKRQEVAERARGRMASGLERVSSAVDALAIAAERHDFAAMQQATEGVAQGLSVFDSGLAAERALVEGHSPRTVALQWFKREMHLPATPYGGEQRQTASGFHYFAMLVLAACAAILGAVQMARIRRARELADRLTTSAAGRGGQLRTLEAAAAPSGVVVPQTHEPLVAQVPSTTGAWSGQLRIARIFQETPTTKTFRLAPLRGENLPFTFEPGQFLAVGVAVDGRQLKRSYSIASSPCCQGWCEITVRHVAGGAVSAVLHERMRVGDTIDVAGPFGRFTFRGREASSVVMIAGGVGITPLMSSIRFLTDQSWAGDIYLIYGTSQLDEVIFREELDYLGKRHANLHVTICLSAEPSQAWTGARGRITRELLQASVPEVGARRVHVCGPPPMMEAMKAALAGLGVPSDAVKTELFLSPEVKVAPLVPAPSGVQPAATCTFARSEKKAPLPLERTILDVAEEVDVAIDYSCRQGFCGACKVRLLEGHVSMAVEDGLSSSEKTGGWILACQAKSEADVSVDA